MKYSEQLSNFLSFLRSCEDEFITNEQLCKIQEDLTQDYLHELELGNHNYDGRAKISTQLAKCRKKRRVYKDIMLEVKPIADFVKNNKEILHKLESVLGEVRKVEKSHVNRVYVPRVKEH